MLGIGIDDVPVLSVSRQHGLGEDDLDKITLLGDFQVPPILRGFTLPKRFKSDKQRNGKTLSSVIHFLKSRPAIDSKLCKNCNTCVESCPVQAIDKKTKTIDYEKCIECLCCHELCMYKAVKLKSSNPIASVVKKLAIRG